MKVAVLQFPGSNCDQDALWALRQAGLSPTLVWHTQTSLQGFDAAVLPGGFSFGDYLRAGALAKFSPVMQALQEFAHKGYPVVGICNGFQVLTEAGLLPGALLANTNLHFTCRPVWLRVERNDLAFTNRYQVGQVLQIPIAHGEGRYYASESTLQSLEDHGQVVFRYVQHHGKGGNPNGSLNDIAGIVNRAGNVLGLMPHPERATEALLGSQDGWPFFASLAAKLAGAL